MDRIRRAIEAGDAVRAVTLLRTADSYLSGDESSEWYDDRSLWSASCT